MSPNDADGMANSVDPDQTAPVCPGISVRKLWILTVIPELFLCKIDHNYESYLEEVNQS